MAVQKDATCLDCIFCKDDYCDKCGTTLQLNDSEYGIEWCSGKVQIPDCEARQKGDG